MPPAAVPRSRPDRAVVGAGIGLAGVLATQVAVRAMPGYLPSRAGVLPGVLLWWVLGATTAALLVRSANRRAAAGLLLAGILAVHTVAATGPPQLSDDLYRYAWDGRVQAAGIDPYRYGPLDPHLAGLRDRWLFPDAAGCAAIERGPHCIRLNYPRAHTIYPPVAQAYFTAVHYLPGPPREHKLQLYGSLLSLALTGLLMRMLIARGRDPRYAAFYALSPLAGLEIGSDAHVDVLGALLALAGLAVLTRRRLHPPPVPLESVPPSRRRAAAAGALLGAAVAVKLYPALLLPAAARRRPVALVGAALGVVGLAYLPHLLAVGTGVLGFLPQYLDAEGYGQGARFLLLVGVLHLGGAAAKAVAVAVLAAVTVAVWRTDPDRVPPERAALWTVGAAFLVATPVQPWYGVLLAALAVVAGRLEWLAVAAAAYPVYVSLFTDLPGDAWTLRVASYSIAAVVVLAVTGLRRRYAVPGSSVNRDGGRKRPALPLDSGVSVPER
ncbi:glycosyltransferase 87 family protein [Frankia tisae]|uniref:glycosyltransferase 87 family protein n=1 Tax=Frankia tisae TaxID=2950104 RepID=UPI0021C20D38|nr:glycosyltransferase 87 family protein [Frankia tisae]